MRPLFDPDQDTFRAFDDLSTGDPRQTLRKAMRVQIRGVQPAVLAAMEGAA